VLGGLPGLPTITYGGTIGSTVGIDGEGRVTQVIASTGQNPVTGVGYNSASLPSQVTFGSGDNDVFAYDPNTLRMTQFKFNVGTQSNYYNGALTWNANSTLGQLAITDQFNSSDTQTCVYSHDDITRIATANCGSAANQGFSYDPFGNISKSGSPYSFMPTYSTNPPTNRFSSLPGCSSLSYDNDGNVTNDCNHSYTWDAEGNSISIDAVDLTFDAFDRAIEKNVSGTYTEMVFAPTGDKLALMNGHALTTGFVPLPGQATAVYTSAGLDHYRHSDWLGSARLTSSPSQAYISSVAYAPFGETYASSGTTDPSFTGMDPHTVSTDYDFLYRPYSTQGRWPTPDPAGLAAADPTNPQSWNRYAYVLNNPLSFRDMAGLYCYYGDTTPGSADWFDNSQYDMMSTQGECAAPDENGNVGVWTDDPTYSVEVSADPLSDSNGLGQWILDFGNSYLNLNIYQLSADLNRCAAENTNQLYSKVLGQGKIANALGGNAFAGASELLLGPDRKKAAAHLATDASVHNVLPLAGQAVGQIATRMGTQIYAVPGTTMELGGQTRWATVIERYVAQRVKDLPAFKTAMAGAEDVLDGKILLDGATYLSMEISCVIP
jgi:RHS repeat-associated protein